MIAAANIGLSALAITDHDTLSALAVARPEATRLGLELVGGIELTAEFEGREVHILGHFVRDDEPALVAVTMTLRRDRVQRLKGMVDRLAELGLSVDLTALGRAFPRATLGRRHLAEWLVRTGQVAGHREAFARYLGDDGPAHVPKPRLAAAVAIALVQAAGGVAGLAHPPYDLRELALRNLVEAGLGSMEVEGHGIDARRGQRLRDWADRYQLVPIAGSDFHAADRPGRWIGSITTPGADLERLRKRADRFPLPSHSVSDAPIDPKDSDVGRCLAAEH
ncbi:PHP domain-containing protein [Singulisphaera sp. Ch08]|uniref:PHP domain-containing protein n=1 Tax=Singulisphaera sp. Ch08 TaxID=3120278 RepID=A0AAU7C744_9BACT